jgi:microcystin-dependent protein
MSILVKGTDFGPTEQVTSAKLDNLVDAAKFTDTSESAVSYTGSTGTCLQGGGLEVTSAGQLQIQDGEVDLVKLSTNNALNSGLYGVLDKVYPVGSIYIATVSTNPDTLMFGGSGNTTWEAFGAGKTLVGIDSGDTDFDASEETGGVKSVTLTAAQSGLPAHNHLTVADITDGENVLSGSEVYITKGGDNDNDDRKYLLSGTNVTPTLGQTKNSTAANASSAHTNLQPYIVTYMWKRTA